MAGPFANPTSRGRQTFQQALAQNGDDDYVANLAKLPDSPNPMQWLTTAAAIGAQAKPDPGTYAWSQSFSKPVRPQTPREQAYEIPVPMAPATRFHPKQTRGSNANSLQPENILAAMMTDPNIMRTALAWEPGPTEQDRRVATLLQMKQAGMEQADPAINRLAEEMFPDASSAADIKAYGGETNEPQTIYDQAISNEDEEAALRALGSGAEATAQKAPMIGKMLGLKPEEFYAESERRDQATTQQIQQLYQELQENPDPQRRETVKQLLKLLGVNRRQMRGSEPRPFDPGSHPAFSSGILDLLAPRK